MPNLSLPAELQNLNLTPSQLAALFSHFQSQSAPAPLPPLPSQHPPFVPPPQAYPSASANAAVQPAVQPSATQSQDQVRRSTFPHPQHGRPTVTPHMSIPPIDREEGELSDTQNHRVEPLTPGRKRKLDTAQYQERIVSHRPSDYNSTSQTNHHTHPRPLSATRSDNDDLILKKEMALPFVAALYNEGFTFDELVREGLDATLLRRTFEDLHLPTLTLVTDSNIAKDSPTANLALNLTNGTAKTADATPAAQPKRPDLVKPSMAKPAASVPGDRQSYLARLQAAKNKKPSAPASKPPTPVKAPPPPPPSTEVPVIRPGPPSLPLSVPTVQPPAVAQQPPKSLPSHPAPTKEQQPASKTSDAATELVRKKMEALKSLKRRMATQQPVASPAPPQDVPSTNTASLTHASQEADEPASANTAMHIDQPLSVTPQPQPSFGIPGLFMSGAPWPSSAASTPAALPSQHQSPAQGSDIRLNNETSSQSEIPPLQSATKTRRRPVAADLNEAQTPPEVPKYKRPFGRSRQNSSDDAMIIEVSDDEGTVGDGESAVLRQPPPMSAIPPTRQKSIRDLPPLRDFPPRPVTNKSGVLQGVLTPLGTPGTTSETEELRKKEVELSALKAKIVELERRKKAAKAKAQLDQSRTETPVGGLSASSSIPGITSSSLPGVGLAMAEPSGGLVTLQADISASNAALDTRRTQMMELQRQMAMLQQQCEEDDRKKQDQREINSERMSDAETHSRIDHVDAQVFTSQPEMPVRLALTEDRESSVEAVSTAAVQVNGSESSAEEGQISEDSPVAGRQRNTAHSLAHSNNDSQATTVDDRLASATHTAVPPETADQTTFEDNDEGSSMSESSESEEDDYEAPDSFTDTVPPEHQRSPAASSDSGSEMSTSETSSDESDDEAGVSNVPEESSKLNTSADEDDGYDEAEMDLDTDESDDDLDYEPAPAQAPVVPQSLSVTEPPAEVADVSMANDVVPELQPEPQQVDLHAPVRSPQD